MKYKILTNPNPEKLAEEVNEHFGDKTATWKPLGGVSVNAFPTQVQTLQGLQFGVMAIYSQSLIDYEDKITGLLGAPR